MLPRVQRIKKPLFLKVFRQGRVLVGANIYLRAVENKEGLGSPSKFAFISPKTAAKKAVGRNRLRRLGYAVIRDLKKTKSQIKNGYLCVFTFKKSSTPPAYRVVFEEVKNLLLKAGLIENTNSHEYDPRMATNIIH